MQTQLLAKDLDFILTSTKPIWHELHNKNIFITGGTGFFGTWLLESLVWANRCLNVNVQATVLTRHPQTFAKKCPHLYNDSHLQFYAGDVRDFAFPPGKFDFIIHAATDASAQLNNENPLLMFDTILAGTRRVLDFATQCGAPKILFLSSGAVYGRQPPELTHIAEEYSGIPDALDPRQAYAVGKYTAEHLCALYAKQYGLMIKIARCFAFVGPYLPLDIHFAIGNFILNGLKDEAITIKGDGTPYRSYLYAADLMVWLWTILVQGQSLRPYNVGSDEVFSIKEIAQLVANSFEPSLRVNIAQKANPNVLPERYVPAIKRVRDELNLVPQISIQEAIQSTIGWYKAGQPAGVKAHHD